MSSLLYPLCAQVLLTLTVWVWMYITRLGTMYRKKIDPQELADEARALSLLKGVVNPSDNLENLFELPVLFYVAILVLITTGFVDSTYVTLAWAFVAFRSLHSFIHCAYNKITHRFAAYLFSSIALWAIWIRIAARIVLN